LKVSISWENTARTKARLTGERGAIVKDWGGRIPVAAIYPNTYFVGMSSLGFQIVYTMLNQQPDFVCERAFFEAAGKRTAPESNILSLESQRPLGDFAALAFSVTFELDYYHVVATLRMAGLPVYAGERDERHPLVIGGGPCLTANPEPVAPFFDAIVIGEAEPALPGIVEALRTNEDRDTTLRALANVPGVYVPSLYEPAYAADGQLRDVRAAEGAPSVVSRVWLHDLDDAPGSSAIVAEETELANIFLIEVARGCARGCRFCLAGYCFLPVRERRPENVLAAAQRGLEYTRRVGLVGAAVSDYRHLDDVVRRLQTMGAQVSVSSLRVDSLSEPITRALVESGARTITLGLEAGSQRLRDIVHKDIDYEQVMRAADIAGRAGIAQAKLYYMLGLPGETDADVQELIDLTLAVAERLGRHRPGARVVVGLTPFVPKAQTPFQWMPMAELGLLKERVARIQAALRARKVEVRAEGVEWAVVEGVLARGDRRLARALAAMDRSSLAAWHRALSREGLAPDFYLRRQRSIEEPLPWAAISTGVTSSALARLGEEARRATSH
jgi:radical SAM superfamily enzyme YgiQ (UPF0313 family)